MSGGGGGDRDRSAEGRDLRGLLSRGGSRLKDTFTSFRPTGNKASNNNSSTSIAASFASLSNAGRHFSSPGGGGGGSGSGSSQGNDEVSSRDYDDNVIQIYRKNSDYRENESDTVVQVEENERVHVADDGQVAWGPQYLLPSDPLRQATSALLSMPCACAPLFERLSLCIH